MIIEKIKKTFIFQLFFNMRGLIMKAINKTLTSFVFLLGTFFSMNLPAWDATTTINHLDEAIKAMKENKLETAELHMKKARQTGKEIIGGSLEVTARKASGLIKKARLQAQNGDLNSASLTLKEAIGLFKTMHDNSKGGRGGLN
ncbi:MAG: hypothetical protein ACU836_04645 [Gammaproteobacteria bacterium]